MGSARGRMRALALLALVPVAFGATKICTPYAANIGPTFITVAWDGLVSGSFSDCSLTGVSFTKFRVVQLASGTRASVRGFAPALSRRPPPSLPRRHPWQRGAAAD